ncbi:hypothetical protein ACFU5O_28095 [Streptomyces sp. NPDC057445]|uniref:hypothetical protein n=1 Tax=Streptomyces sp. NPDC057445 TaxID=3346136 RepID=UPI0036C30F1A
MSISTSHQVHITSDGQLHIDSEPQLVPNAIDPSQVALQVLHIEAAGSGLPVLAHVRDDRSNSIFDIQVMPDGTTQAPDPEAAVGTPIAAPGTDPFARLAAAQAAGRHHDFSTAIPAADQILQHLTSERGATAKETLEVAQFRADLAFLSGDYAYSTSSWTWLALAWYDKLGPHRKRTQIAASNAAAAWIQLPPTEAIVSATDLVNMLLEVTAPERTETMRGQIEARLQQLTT